MVYKQNREVIVGIGGLAEELNCCRGAIYRTMRGTLNSARLRAELKARGLHPKPFRHKRGPQKRKPSSVA